MKLVIFRSVVAASVLAACGGEDVTKFDGYGNGHPGFGLPLGGEIYLNHVKSPSGTKTDIQAYFHNWAAADQPVVEFPAAGECYDFGGTTPYLPDPNETYVDLGPQLTMTGGGKTLVAPKVLDGVDTNWLQHPIMYQQTDIPPSEVPMATEYAISFEGSDQLDPASVYLGQDYTISEPKVGTAPVTLTRGQPLTVKWELKDQTNGGAVHTPDRTFAFIGLWTDDGSTNWYCPLNDSLAATRTEFTIPAAVIDSLPESGTIQMGAPTHEMAKFMDKRVDVYGISCNISPFSF